MFRIIASLAVGCGVVFASVSVADEPPASIPLDAIVDEFVKSLDDRKELEEETKTKVLEMVKSLRADEQWKDAVITVALREIYPAYQTALTSLGEERFDEATEQLKELMLSEDPYLSADAEFYLARTFVMLERYEDALPRLEALADPKADKSLHATECTLLHGLSAARLLDRETAMMSLERYLAAFPDAPERMRYAAWRQLTLLRTLKEGQLEDVFERMDYCARRLSQEHSAGKTREQQDKIVAMLDNLIEEAEERECGACSGGGGGGSQSQGQSGGGGGNPADGQGEGGQGGNDQTAGDAEKREHRGGPRSAWDQMRQRDRDRVLGAIKGRFPSRYRQLIEEYYRELQEDEDE
jgi:tetratricopeptide (TPR) repeat protein